VKKLLAAGKDKERDGDRENEIKGNWDVFMSYYHKTFGRPWGRKQHAQYLRKRVQSWSQ
jgi:hypothetical protein